MSAVFILLAVGALIGTWNMAGTIPTVVDYGIRIVSPTWFYFTAAAVCALVGMVTGSSWTTAGTLGVAFVGMSNVLGLEEAIAAGAVICGAYFGDKMTPLSETTILVPQLVGGGLTVGTAHPEHDLDGRPGARRSAWSIFLLPRPLRRPATPTSAVDEARAALATAFDISVLNLLPLVLLVVFAVLRMPPFLSILGSALFAAVLAPFLQWDAVVAFVDDPSLGKVATSIEAGYAAMATGFESHSGFAPDRRPVLPGRDGQHADDDLAGARALSFAAVMEHAGFLQRLLEPLVARTERRGSLIAAVIGSGDRPQRDRRRPVRRRRPARPIVPRGVRPARPGPQVLSRAVEDSGTVTSPLVPWNTCGAYMSGVLGVTTVAYLPFCFFNLLSPLLDVLYGYIGFKVPDAEQPWEDEAMTASTPVVTPGDAHV